MLQASGERRDGLRTHYRYRAEELRVLAGNYIDPARKTLLDIATMYENLAEEIAGEMKALVR